MSERLNSVDIEDVLSSIRRLVSDDLRPAPRGTVPRAAHVEPPQADKLILTPALRIAPELEEPAPEEPAPLAARQDPPASMEQAAPSEPVMSFHSVRPERGAARLDAVMGQVARGLESGSGDWETAAEPPARFESGWAEPEPEPAQAPAFDDVLADAQELMTPHDPQQGDDVWTASESEAPFVDLDLDSDFGADRAGDAALYDADPVPAMDVLPGADALDQVMNDPRDVTSDMTADALADPWPVQDWAAPGEPDLLLDAAALDAPHDAEWTEPETAGIESQPVAMAEEPAMTDKDDPADLPHSNMPDPDLPDWARMETEPVDPAPVDIDPPVTPAAATHHGSADPRWADAAEAEIRRELEDGVTASAFARFADDDLDDRSFDEDMLRDLVRDIIREELQGALGERITRNVRKLVRAEIARALAVRDFE
jgi:hypothetical protein